MTRSISSGLLLALLLSAPASALDAIQSTTVAGRSPVTSFCTTPTSLGGLAINRADGTLSFCTPSSGISTPRVMIDPAQPLSTQMTNRDVSAMSSLRPGASVARNLSDRLGDSILATDFAAVSQPVDPTAALDSTAGIQAAIAYAQTSTRALAGVVLPCGHYKISATLKITASNINLAGERAGCVRIERYANFGPSLLIASPSGQIGNIRVADIAFFDLAAANGTVGYSTCATSPYQVVADGVSGLTLDRIAVAYGCGGIALNAVYNAYLTNPDIQIFPIPGHPEENGNGTGLYVGFSANANLPLRYSSLVWIANAGVEGGSLSTVNGAIVPSCKLKDGIRLDGQDGAFASNSHVQCTVQADYHFAHSGPYPMYNVNFSDLYADISLGHGILMDGSVAITGRSLISGRASAAASGGAGAHGVYATGAGGGANLTLDLSVDGYQGSGIRFEGTNWSNLTMRPRQIVGNNLGNTGQSGVFINQVSRLSITGGVIGGDGKLAYGINLGAGVNGATITGVNASSNLNYGLVAASGANNILASGNNFGGNPNGGIVDQTASGANVVLSGNIGTIQQTASGTKVTTGNLAQ